MKYEVKIEVLKITGKWTVGDYRLLKGINEFEAERHWLGLDYMPKLKTDNDLNTITIVIDYVKIKP